MRRLALLSLVPAALALTAPALRPRARGRFLRSSPDDDEAPPEINEDFRDFRARLIARTKGEGLTEAGDSARGEARLALAQEFRTLQRRVERIRAAALP